MECNDEILYDDRGPVNRWENTFYNHREHTAPISKRVFNSDYPQQSHDADISGCETQHLSKYNLLHLLNNHNFPLSTPSMSLFAFDDILSCSHQSDPQKEEFKKAIAEAKDKLDVIMTVILDNKEELQEEQTY